MLKRILKTTAFIGVFALVLGLAGAAQAFDAGGTPVGTGPDTITWTGNGATGGVVDTMQCGDDAKFPDGVDVGPNFYLHWVFTTDGGSASGANLHLGTTAGGNQLGDFAPGPPLESKTFHFYTPYFTPDTTTLFAYADFTVDDTGNGSWNLNISHGCPGANITIPKTIPNVLQGYETVTVTFSAVLQGDDPATDPIRGTCSITFAAGETSKSCTITGLAPNTAYDIYETDTGGFDDQPFQTVMTGAGGSTVEADSFDNTFTPATAQACKVTDVDNTGFDPKGETFTFDLNADGVSLEQKTVTIGDVEGDCVSFEAELQDNVTYTITEVDPDPWTADGSVCTVNGYGPVDSFTPQYPGDKDALFSCTFTNSITAATATVRKVTVPAGSEPGFTFNLLADGVEIAEVVSTGTGALDFGVDLQDGVLYTITEDPKLGWTSDGGVGCSFTPDYPTDSGRIFECVFTNTPARSNGLTIGYWKNHLAPEKIGSQPNPACSGLPTGTSCSKNGPFTSQYLPKTLGTYPVNTVLKAAQVFAANSCGASDDKSAVNCLAAQLLAAELNVANLASTCANQVIADANTFLTSISYVGPAGNYALTAAQRVTAITLKTALDQYNNGTCPV